MQQVFFKFLPSNVKHVTISDMQNLFFCDWSRKAQEFGAARGLSAPPAALQNPALAAAQESSPAKSGKGSARKTVKPPPAAAPSGPAINASKLYDEQNEMKVLQVFVESQLEDYNLLSKAPMDLVVFRFLIDHLVRIGRILKQPNGHALLLGTIFI